METIEEKLGTRIAKHRIAIMLTQAELAERVEVQPETISRIETGKRAPSLALIAQISEALHLELHELFRLSDPENPKLVALERLARFASRLTAAEIQFVIDLGALALGSPRRTQAE